MKSFKLLYLFLLVSLLITSCSNNDDSDGGNSDVTPQTGNYFPSSLNDYWNYDVSNTDNTTTETIVSTDSLYVTSQTGATFTLDANNNMIANGTMNDFLTNGELTTTENDLVMNGILEIPTEISDFIDFEIQLSNIILYDTNASDGDELSSSSDSFQQDFNGIPTTITYELTTNARGNSESLILNGENYSNVISSDLKLNLSVIATVDILGFPTNIAILESQEVLSITNYYAQEIGLVRSESVSNYQISEAAISALELAGIEIGVPSSGSTSNIQELSDYFVAE